MKLHLCMYHEMYDILKSKNDLVHSVHYLMNYICNIVKKRKVVMMHSKLSEFL